MGRPTNTTAFSTDIEKMAPSTLDLLILTFNCAKNLIDVSVFASHLQGALSQGAAGLPDLVVFSLQEVAPLSYSFVGSYFLSPYYARYEEALNLASARATLAASSSDGPSSPRTSDPDLGGPAKAVVSRPYALVRAKNVGMTSILLFAKDPSSIRQIEEAECGFGASDMGNKGAVALRVTWSDAAGGEHPSDRQTEVAFVATHLAAMEWNLKKRNANWRAIMSGLTFANPRAILPGVFPTANQSATRQDMSGAGSKVMPTTTTAESSSEDSSEAEAEAEAEGEAGDSDAQPLLNRNSGSSSGSDQDHLSAEQRTALQDISIFKPGSHLFVAGDLNYRISSTTPPPRAPFPSFDPASENYFPNFLPRDQLTQERLAGRTFHGMTEAPIMFGPTYKYDVQSTPEDATNEAAVRAGATVNGVPEVPWRFASHRWPGWCDRVLYLDLPAWLSRNKKSPSIEVKAYDSMPVVRTSDHRPVFLRVHVPILGVDAMKAPPMNDDLEVSASARQGGSIDPRIAPPVSVDVHAWERRAAARRREIIVGWSAMLWSTREGAVVMATLLASTATAWWFWRM